MKITVSHDRTKEAVKDGINRSFDEVFSGAMALPVKLTQPQKRWDGDTLAFSVVVDMGLMTTPIRGTILVTDHDVIIEADLGMLERFIPAEKAKQVVSDRIRGLLK